LGRLQKYALRLLQKEFAGDQKGTDTTPFYQHAHMPADSSASPDSKEARQKVVAKAFLTQYIKNKSELPPLGSGDSAVMQLIIAKNVKHRLSLHEQAKSTAIELLHLGYWPKLKA
jgi:hypothetical protein